MSIVHEKAFEDEIVRYLHANDWLTPQSDRERDAEYDRERALIPGDVFGWLEETQPEQLAKIIKTTDPAEAQAKARANLLDRLAKTLALPHERGGGALNVLRRGMKMGAAQFSLCEFKPATSLNADTLERYRAVRVRIMRQVHYSTKHQNSIDLVCFVNGIPVATLELKTDNVQSIDDAKNQYRFQRDPKGEPLLQFARTLVHFAVSNDEVWMTTRLDGAKTRFLPFNRGDDGRAGNPPVPGKSATSYLWERVLDRDAWLRIIGRLLHIQTEKRTDPITGEQTTSTTLLFSRFHQWEAVTELLDAARAEGPGHRYLIQHSAGSGKTNSIAWLAHGLANLFDDDNRKVFDSVIVVTDRNVLDSQLRAAIREIEQTDGIVGAISADEIRKLGDRDVTSKSALLSKELGSGRLIIIVTIQTFPFALEAIRSNRALVGKTFAIIADEAHSAQTGQAAAQLRQVLTADEQAELADGGAVDIEAILAAELAQRAASPNLSFFAFTATPKAKTLELFGRQDANGQHQPFHLYSMQQAITEGYILDVLQNYTAYEMAFTIAQDERRRRLEAVDGDSLIDEREATKKLMRWVSLHPTNIAQKAKFIVDHYREHVQHLLGGHAKAMIVAASREHAARYKAAIDAYIAKEGYDIGTLVAFSGSLPESVIEAAVFPGIAAPYTESGLNPTLRGRGIPQAFAGPEFQVLIVANKYQTGFDQPLLCGMYVDKRLSGVTAVQTLSRLNRTYAKGGKDTTYVLDFVNQPEDILADFQVYFRDAKLEAPTDPNIVHDLQAKLDQGGVYTPAEVEAFADAVIGGGSHGAHQAPLQTAAKRFNEAFQGADDANDRAELERLILFRSDVGAFLRAYDFLSQIDDYESTYLEKLAMFLRLLQRRMTGRVTAEPIDLSEIGLEQFKLVQQAPAELTLLDDDGSPGLAPMQPGGGSVHDPKLARLREIIDRINEVFGGEFSAGRVDSFQAGIVAELDEDERLRSQAQANSKRQFLQSPDLERAVQKSMLGHMTTQQDMVAKAFENPGIKAKLFRLLGELAWESLQDTA